MLASSLQAYIILLLSSRHLKSVFPLKSQVQVKMAEASSSSTPTTLFETSPQKNPSQQSSSALPVCNQPDPDPPPISPPDPQEVSTISCEDSSIILAVSEQSPSPIPSPATDKLTENELKIISSKIDMKKRSSGPSLSSETKRSEHKTEASLMYPAREPKWEPRVRPNSFVAMRIPSVEIRDGLKSVQHSLMKFDRDMKHVITSLDKLHLTLLVLKLADDSEVERAISTLEVATKKVVRDYNLSTDPLVLTLKGVGTFGQKVLFAEIEDGPSKERLQEIAGVLKSVFMAEKFPGIDPNPFNPHLTIAKMSTMPQNVERRHQQRTGRRKCIDRRAYAEFRKTEFGRQVVDGLELLSMKLPADSQGYYHCFHKNQFNAI